MQAHNSEGAFYVTDLQLVRALQHASDEEFFALINTVHDGKGDPNDPHILDKALFVTVSRYKSSLSHDPVWIMAAENLIKQGAKIDHKKMEEIWKEVTEDQFGDPSFVEGHKEMEAILKTAESLNYTLTLPKIYAKPPRAVSQKETSVKQSQQVQDSKSKDIEEVYSAPTSAPEADMNELAKILKTQLRSFISNENKAEKVKEHAREIKRNTKNFEKTFSKPKKVTKKSDVSSLGSVINQLARGKEKKIDDQERQFTFEHKQQEDSIKKAEELLSKLNQGSNPEKALQDFHKYLLDNQRREESIAFDEELLRGLNGRVYWQTALAIKESAKGTLREPAITIMETFFRERQERIDAQEQKERKIAEEGYRRSLEESGDIVRILDNAFGSAKNKYEAAYKNFSWVSYYFNHALTGTTVTEAKKLYSIFSQLKNLRDDFHRKDDVEFRQAQEKLMMQLLGDYLNIQGGLLSQHKDPLDEHSFGTFLLKECYKSQVLRQHFGWDNLAPKVSYGVLAAAEKFLQKYAPVFAVTVFHALVGDYSGENMANSRSGRELMRSKMIDKLNLDVGQSMTAVPVVPKQV